MLKYILFYIGIFLIPELIGMLYNRIVKNEVTHLIQNFVYGFVICLGLFEVFVLPCIYFKTSLTFLTTIYIGLLVGLCMVSICLNYYNIGYTIRRRFSSIKEAPWPFFFAVVVVLFQVYMYIAYQHTDADDATYVGFATVAVETDTIFEIDPEIGGPFEMNYDRYVLSPFPIFTAVLSKVSNIHSTILAHTILPGVYLCLSYGVLILLGTYLFEKNVEKVCYFVLISAVVAMFFSTSIYTQSTFMLFRLWQGKAFLASMLLPFIFYLGYRCYIGEWKSKEYTMLFFTMLACCLVSSMGIMLGAISVGISGIIEFTKKRNYKCIFSCLLCCLPNVVLAIAYLNLKGGI